MKYLCSRNHCKIKNCNSTQNLICYAKFSRSKLMMLALVNSLTKKRYFLSNLQNSWLYAALTTKKKDFAATLRWEIHCKIVGLCWELNTKLSCRRWWQIVGVMRRWVWYKLGILGWWLWWRRCIWHWVWCTGWRWLWWRCIGVWWWCLWWIWFSWLLTSHSVVAWRRYVHHLLTFVHGKTNKFIFEHLLIPLLFSPV